MKALKLLLKIFICIVIVLAVGTGAFLLSYQPSLTLDFSVKTGKLQKGASGYLYGIAESGVPSIEMAQSLSPSTIVQKVSGGLQHPVGDMDKVYQQVPDTKYNIIYLQDIYDSWYYLNDDIMQQRKNGSYDFNSLLENDYLPKVKAIVTQNLSKPYANKLVYCLYNETDNGVWFGETKQSDDENNQFGIYAEYNKQGRDNFNSAWKKTYDLVKSINPSALVGGPGFSDYDSDEIEYFFSFCKKNNCVPDIMIYHELGEKSIYFWQEHLNNFKSIEKKLGISELPVIVSEYGKTDDNGCPGQMIKYITCIENSKVYADNAFWRLADNFNDNCADDNSPNSQWWLMRWYSQMSGQTVKGRYKDLWNSDFKNSIRDKKSLNYQGFMGIGSISDNEKEIDIICGGNDSSSKVVLKNLDKTKLGGKMVEITVEETVYKGIFGISNESVVLKKYTKKAGSQLKINIENPDKSNAYHIVVKEADESAAPAYENTQPPVRYEFENGKLLGNAYTYDSYCPASGGAKNGDDLTGGFEKKGDGVEIEVEIPEDSEYKLDFIYGNSNDGKIDKNGRQNPNDRNDSVALLTIGSQKEKISLPNTIKSEYTSCYTVTRELKKGKHKVVLEHNKGTFVLDSLVITPINDDETKTIAVLSDDGQSSSELQAFIAVAPDDGYYSVTTSVTSPKIIVCGKEITTNEISGATVYLKKGLNYIDVKASEKTELTVAQTDEEPFIALSPDNAKLSGGSIIKFASENRKYIDGISSLGGSAQFSVNAPRAGKYMITLSYSNNEEYGYHDYNVDLVERCVTVSSNSQTKNIYCRSTYSWDTVKTVTFDLNLNQGDNLITLSNNESERFNNKNTYTPYIFGLTINPLEN